jgi:type VI secretion system secreted protein VgrG
MSVAVEVRIGGLTLRDKDVGHLQLRQELGSHTHCAIGFTRDRATDLRLEEMLGARLNVGFRSLDGVEQKFEGVIGGGVQSPNRHGGSGFSLEAISLSVRMEYRSTAYFPKSDVSQIAGALGATVVGGGGGPKLDYVQYGESDFSFLLRIAEEQGFFVRTSGSQPELHKKFQDGPGGDLVWGNNLLELSASARPVNPGFKGSFYDPKEKHDYRLHGIRRTPEWTGGAGALVQAVSNLSVSYAGGGDPQVEEFPARARNLADYRSILEHKSSRLLGNAVRVEGLSTHVGLTAGNAYTIREGQDHPLSPQLAGKVGLTGVTHYWDGAEYSNRFVATPWAGFTRASRPPRRLMPGPVTAEVVENEDPKRRGRIRVRYRWQDSGEVTHWIRYLTPHSGHERGMLFLPEVGDEVLVAFEQGDPERPVVLGSLWNGKDQSPEVTEKNSAKRIVTRSGNTIQFLDEGGKETIEIYSATGSCFVQLANDVGGKPLVTVRSGGDLSLEAEGEIRMKCESLTQRVAKDAARIVGMNDVVKAGQNAVTKAGQTLSIEGTTTSVKAASNLTAVAGATANLAGAMVQIQPPALVNPPVQTRDPSEEPSVWEAKETPKPAPGKSTSQRPTPRSSG